MLVVVLSGFVLALAVPSLHRLFRNRTGWLLAALPLGLFTYLAFFIRPVSDGGVFFSRFSWVPSLGIEISFYMDGLSLLFGLIITGIGTLVLIYANGYLAGHQGFVRFYVWILSFMAAMLGVVLGGNLITIFVFWELTSLTSYLLIGSEHERESARTAAWQALLVTSFGGLALLAGFLMLGKLGGTFELPALLSEGETIRTQSLYRPIFILILLGAMTKSAQFPFHFWLPNAMAAPTPVSTYLHSATMVKAGVYLLARLSPVLGGTPLWKASTLVIGATTMLIGAYLSVRKTDMKAILAYSTVAILGVLVFLLGLGTRAATEALVTYLIIHCLYKAALFLVVGILDHGTGTRDVTQLGGLSHLMPITAGAAILAALSMAGLPPLYGFVGKELLYGATLGAPVAPWLLTAVVLLTNVFMVVAAGLVSIIPFIGTLKQTPKTPYEAPFSFWLGPVLLAGISIVIGVLPGPVAGSIVSPAVAAVMAAPATAELSLLHGLNLQLLLSAITFACGAAAYYRRDLLLEVSRRLDFIARFGPARMYTVALNGMIGLARLQTRILQSGHLHYYLLITVLTTIVLVGLSFFQARGWVGPPGWSEIRFHEWIVALVLLVAVWIAVRARSRLTAMVALGVIGYSVVLVYIMFGAPDLAMTQFSIDTLTVILLVLVLYRLPRYRNYSTATERFRDAVPAVAAGALVTLLVMVATATPTSSRISSFFAENSYLLAKGRNIVNVILVDFRAFDTMGEITVLAVAGIGVYALLRLRVNSEEAP